MRARLLVLGLAAVLVSGCGGPTPADVGSSSTRESAPASQKTAVVDYVVDGDTLRTVAGQRIRLVQIDAPELHADCYGHAALVALRRLVPKGTQIGLSRDPRLDDVDGYGRLLRYVFVGARNVNLLLVRGGAATPYFFHGERGRYAKALLAAVRDARARRAGAWGSCPGAELRTGSGSHTGPP
jgi:micrococcal nuclease